MILLLYHIIQNIIILFINLYNTKYYANANGIYRITIIYYRLPYIIKIL
jgi:hypothetical protein